MRVVAEDNWAPDLFKKTADGWVECCHDREIKDGESFWYTSGEIRLLGAVEEFDYLHAELVALLPHPLLVTVRRNSAIFLSHILRMARKVIPRKQPRPAPERWELVHEIVKNLGKGWQVRFARLWDGGVFDGKALGPDNMELYFRARGKKVEPGYEYSYPSLGWLRVNGGISFCDDKTDLLENLESPILDAKISIELPDSMTADEMANEIIARLLPPYRDILGVAEKHRSELSDRVTDES